MPNVTNAVRKKLYARSDNSKADLVFQEGVGMNADIRATNRGPPCLIHCAARDTRRVHHTTVRPRSSGNQGGRHQVRQHRATA